uniref:YDG domain-containing protein n=1 Tax=Setaria digitata TaxID=48799 RepID=A0A915PV91_9BILA
MLSNQQHTRQTVVTKLTVYEDGAIEAECNKLPCGSSGTQCSDNQASCRAESDTFSSMKWASNGQSILKSCCTLSVPRKMYIGTDLVSLGSYYTGGMVDQKDLYNKEGPEGGVRVWVYRVICPRASDISGESTAKSHMREMAVTQKPLSNNENTRPAHAETIAESPGNGYRPINPLQYRPSNQHLRQQDSPIDFSSRGFFERLI